MSQRTKILLFTAAWCVSQNAWGFIPSFTNMVKEVLDGRTTKPSYVQLRHRVRKGDAFQEIEEQITQDRGRIQFSWKSGGQTYSGTRTRDGYTMDSDKKLASKSAIFLRYFFTGSSEDLTNTLINEGFVRQAQTQGFKPGFTLEGEPATWNLKENFVIQPDFYLVRLPTDIAIVVVGSNSEESARLLFFDEELRGIRRVEWKESGKTYAWNFQHFTEFKNLGRYPKLMSFEAEGNVVAETSLVSILTPEARKQPKPTRSNASIPDNDEELLDVLLSYR